MSSTGNRANRTQYAGQGFVAIADVLTPEELEEARQALDELLGEAAGLSSSNGKFSITLSKHGVPVVRRIFNPILHHPAFLELMRSKKILDLVEEIVGPNITLHHTKLNLKPPSQNTRFEWHQDYPFAPQTNYDMAAVLIYLDDSRIDNGCLTVIPGSHKLGPLPHVFTAEGALTTKLADESVLANAQQWRSIEVNAGGVSIHHCNLLHSSNANMTNNPRSTLIFQYRAADTIQLFDYGHSQPGPEFGMLLRGERPYVARLLDGSLVKLPPPIDDPIARDG